MSPFARTFIQTIVLASAAIVTGCLPAPKGEMPIHYAENPDVKPAAWEKRGPEARQWTLHTYNELRQTLPSPADLTPRDLKDFCPEYTTMARKDRLNFWVQLVSAMTRYESGFKPETEHTENFKDQYGRQVVSRGLLQMSIGSVEKQCGIVHVNQLHNPFRNLSCGVKLLVRYVSRDGVLSDKVGDNYQGGARYWAVLRPGHKDFLANIQSATKSFCENYR
ncbi:MAG: transglycosylase SLT domain-containing protein [Bdellovibrionaceae bacterium]|nr:transglycosylase SLT domain-containing protein [Pseudobdellovibrionaceae bacterium]